MTGRERVLKAVSFEEADRVPIDLGGSAGASGIHLIAYDKLRRYLGVPTGRLRCNDIMQQLAVVEEEIRERLHVDVLRISSTTFCDAWHPYPLYDGLTVELPERLDLQPRRDASWVLRDTRGKRYIKPANGLYFDAEDGRGWYGFGMPMTDEALKDLAENTRQVYESTGYALAASFGGGFASHLPEFLMSLITEPERVEEQLGRACESLIAKYRLIDQAIGKYAFCVVFADDHGMQNGPMMAPGMFAECIAPHYKRFTDWLHAETDLKLYLHSCGSVEALIDTYIDMGVDILNPVQTSAAGMDPEGLKAKYGGRIVFWGGGCDTQSVLGLKPVDQVVEHVAERMRVFAPGGGFVFNQVHVIQSYVAPEQVCAMFDTAFRHGQYPIVEAEAGSDAP